MRRSGKAYTDRQSSHSRLDHAEPYGRSLLRRGGLSRHEAVARTLPRTCSGATASPPRGPSAGHQRPSRPFGLRSLTRDAGNKMSAGLAGSRNSLRPFLPHILFIRFINLVNNPRDIG